jgi:hypothetical protein
VHSEFHTLVTNLQDAMQNVFTLPEGDPTFPNHYAALSQRRKELYEWVAEHTPRPAVGYYVCLKF